MALSILAAAYNMNFLSHCVRDKFKFVSFYLTVFVISGFTLVGDVGEVQADAKFRKWINDFYPVAAKKGVSKSTYRRF